MFQCFRVYTVYFSTVKCGLLQRKNNNKLYINHERSLIVVNARSIDQVIFVGRKSQYCKKLVKETIV